MKDDGKLENFINRELDVRADDRTHRRMRQIVLDAHESSKQNLSASRLTIARRLTMRKPMIEFAAAGVIVAAVVLGVFEFIDTDNKSGVVWADVARKVETSRGVIYRHRIDSNNPSNVSDYSINYLAPAKYRSEGYQSGEPWITMYEDNEARQRVVLLHGKKAYVKEETNPTDEGRQRHADLMDPTKWVGRFLLCEHSELGRKTIDGVLCEGLETTDPGFTGEDSAELPVESIVGRIWVSLETGYPVLLEAEFEGKLSGSATIDQIQWDVALEASIFEPNIPPDYEQM
ncbi:MAG: hypothetical protein ACYTDV_06765 [Planctomycetota bacterium]